MERPTTSAQLQRDSLCEGTTLFRDSVQNAKNPLALHARVPTIERSGGHFPTLLERVRPALHKNKRFTTKL